jgi:uncharacterized phage-associated protein
MFKDTYRYSSVEVAFYIVAWANAHKVTINLTKTQKLLYIAYGANLVLSEDRLCDEHAQAWPYGPVFPRTRKRLLNIDVLSVTMEHSELANVKNDAYLADLIEFVFKGFGEYTAGQLVQWSHQPESAWDRATHQPGFKWGDEIPDAYIAEYFSRLIHTGEQ